MPKKKLIRILALPSFDNVIKNSCRLKGIWRHEYFQNKNPLILELGCGKGNFIIELAQKFPNKNFIGIDLKAARLFTAATRANELQLNNVCFIHTNIENIPDIFSPEEVDNIWITFPDPYPKSARAQKRLTSLRFINHYRKVLKQGGKIHFKTDDDMLFQFSLNSIDSARCTLLNACEDLDNSPNMDELVKIQTAFEKRHRAAGKVIKYIEFQL